MSMLSELLRPGGDSGGGADAFEISFIDDGNSVGRNKTWTELKAYLDSGKKDVIAWYTYDDGIATHTVPIPVKEVGFGSGNGVIFVKFECTVAPSAAEDDLEGKRIALHVSTSGVTKSTTLLYIRNLILGVDTQYTEAFLTLHASLKLSALSNPNTAQSSYARIAVSNILNFIGRNAVQGVVLMLQIGTHFLFQDSFVKENGITDSASFTMTEAFSNGNDNGGVYKTTLTFTRDATFLTVTYNPSQMVALD